MSFVSTRHRCACAQVCVVCIHTTTYIAWFINDRPLKCTRHKHMPHSSTRRRCSPLLFTFSTQTRARARTHTHTHTHERAYTYIARKHSLPFHRFGKQNTFTLHSKFTSVYACVFVCVCTQFDYQKVGLPFRPELLNTQLFRALVSINQVQNGETLEP